MRKMLEIKSGTKMHLAYDVGVGQEPQFTMLCTFARNLDESAFLVSIPMLGGKKVQADEASKLLFRYGEGTAVSIIAGYVDDIVKEGIRSYWKVRRVSEQRQLIQRADERIKVALRIKYSQPTWPADDDGKIMPEEGMSLDISAGGLALLLNRRFEVGESLEVILPRIAGFEHEDLPDYLAAVVCWQREAPKGSIYRMICGVQFRFSESAQKGALQDYVANIKKRYRIQ